MRPPITRWANDNAFVRMAVATVALLVAFAVLPSLFAPISPALAEEPSPIITVDAHTDGLWGDHWSPFVGITVMIDTDTDTDTWNANTDENGNFWLDLRPFDVQAGQSFTATDETTIKEHTVLSLAITGVNDAANSVSGTADAGTGVWVDVHGVPDVGRTVFADSTTGIWVADFDDVGDGGDTFDLVAGTNGYTGQYDGDSDATNADWHVLNPTISVDAHANDAWGGDFLADTTITLTRGLDSCTTTSDEWGNFGFDLRNCPTAIELAVGDLVSMTDDSTTKDVMIVNLAITGVDPVLDTVSGTADSGIEIEVWSHQNGVGVTVTGSAWTANFSGLSDLVPGSNGSAQHYDFEGDSTHAGWHVPDPRFKAGVDNDDLSGWDWVPDLNVAITIDGGLPYSFVTDEWGNFGAGVAFDLVVGQHLVANDGIGTKDFTIRNLYVTDVDVDNDLVHGTSEPGDTVQVDAHGDPGSWREVIADVATGIWKADFSVAWRDQPVFDIVAGSNGNARYYEPDGDETQRSWHVSDPRITASVIHEEVWTYDFPNEPEGQTLYYRLDDPGTPEVDFEGDMPLLVQGTSTESGDRSFGRYDVQAGQILTVRNRSFSAVLGDGVERVLRISNVRVDTVDPDLDLIEGFADPAEGPRVCAWSNDAELCSEDAAFTWNPDNTWKADFTGIGSGVAPGHWNSVSQFEADGDETHFWWNLPPWIVVELAEEDVDGKPLWPDIVRAEQWTGPIVHLEINGTPIAEWVHDGSGEYRFELPGFDIDPGQTVRIYDGENDKTLLVEPLTIDQVNFKGDVPPNTVEGTSNPNRNVRVEARATIGGWWAERWVEADVSGYFIADFGVPGNGWREQWIAELGGAEGLGRNMWLEIYDSDNDRVTTQQCGGIARIEIARSDGRVDAYDFPEGSTVTLEIDDPTPGALGYTGTAVAVRNPGNPCETIATFDLGDFTIPDDATVSASVPESEGGTTVITIVIPFTIDDVDPVADTVFGRAAIGADVYVEADGNWRYVIAKDDPLDGKDVGYWLADFSIPGPDPGEEYVVDLGPGSSGRAIMLDSAGNTTELSWRISAAQFQVDPSTGNIWGNEFAPNSSVTVTVNGTPVPGSPFDTDEGGNFQAELDVVAGDVVSVFDGTTTKSHTVTHLVVTGVDEVTDVVSGTALAGSSVDVWVHDTEAWLQVTACDDVTTMCVGDDLPGTWHADFTGLGGLVAGSNGNSGQCDDDNDCTQAGWWIPAAQFQVSPADNSIGGNEFAPIHEVTITVNGTPVPGSPFDTDEGGNFQAELAVVAGDVVSVSDGTTTKTHTVTDLVITGADEATGVVSGMAEPGSTVDVWIHDDSGTNLTVTACNNSGFPCNGDMIGTWHADFTGLGGLVAGSNGNSGQWDDDGDATMAGWQIVNPTFTVTADGDAVEGWGWNPEAQVTIVFDDDDDPANGVLRQVTTDTDGEGNFRIDLWEDFDIQPDMYVEVTDDDAVKTHWVTGVTVTHVDVDSDVVSGFADPGADVEVTIWTDEFAIVRVVTSCGDPCDDGEPGWLYADFSVEGTDPDRGDEENQPWDIDVGTSGGAFEYDEDGDSTRADWRVLGLPHFGVSADIDFIEGYEFSGDTLTITFDDNDDPADGVLFETSMELDPEGNFGGPLDEEFDVEVDQYVTVTDGITTKTTWVAPVDITDADLAADTITGVADPDVEIFLDDNRDLHWTVSSDEFGDWFADLSGEFDLYAPWFVVANQTDEDDDRTFAVWEMGGIVEGQVLLDDAPLAGVEVWLTPDQHTCTGTEGDFEFADASMIYIGTHGGMAATGPAVDTASACPNSEFVDSDGIPLLGAFHGDFDLWDGYEYIEFNLERAAVLQTVAVEEFDGADWVPLDDVMVQAFDMNDPDFIAAYGSDPDPDAYRDIFNGDLGRIETSWTGAYLFSPPGSTELRYPSVTDVLVLAEAPYGTILGDQTGAAEFVDPDDGVYVGPVVVFRIGPPVITAIVGPDEPTAVDTEATITATFTDPTVGDSHTAAVEWGDGTTTDAEVVFDDGDGTATGTHAYSEAGVYAVVVTVTDSGGLSDSEEFRYIVIYDPDGGFVTGGGWIYSPAGAYAADPTLEGRANFGFVSKYKKGATVPTGNTEFQFQAGDLNFHSDVYDWLVIAGVRVQFKGTGTINGSGEFGFMITAVDEALTPSTDVDLFRIKIWDKTTDEVIYDNQMDEVDGAAVTTEISGGNIVIHKAKK